MIPDDLLELTQVDDAQVRAIGRAIFRVVNDELDPGERGWRDAIEALRGRLEASFEEIDTAMLSPRAVEKLMPLGELTARRSKKGLWALLLLTLGRELKPEHTLELGTCVGISGAYLAASAHLNGGGRLVTLEGAPALADLAVRNMRGLGLDDITVVPGIFRDTLDATLATIETIDLAFIDGHHHEESTQQYFEQLLPRLRERAVVVFDDIRWSEGMERAWTALRKHPAVRLAVDLDRIGICVIGKVDDSKDLTLPSLNAMAAPGRTTSDRARPSAPDIELDLAALPVARLNWGCGTRGEPGWINSDVKRGAGIQLVGDIRDGLALPDECLDYAVSIHALPMIPIPDLVPTLGELRRVLKRGGVLRLSLPDLERGLAAWQRGNRDYFLVPDSDASTLSGKFITQLLWYGYTVSLFTKEWAEELLAKAGFSGVRCCSFQQTGSPHPGITELDNREAESIFLEGVR